MIVLVRDAADQSWAGLIAKLSKRQTKPDNEADGITDTLFAVDFGAALHLGFHKKHIYIRYLDCV